MYDSFLHRISILDISNNYGNDNFEIPDENAMSNEICVSNENVLNEDNVQTTEEQDELVSLNPLKEFLLSNFPLSKFYNGLKTYNYLWKYKVDNEQYKRLGEVLTDLRLQEKKNQKLLESYPAGNEYGTVGLSVVLYISEWYKRECDTLDGDKCLELKSIGLNSGKSEKVWKSSHLPEIILHQNENESQMRQIAMCALGGLPINYVNNANRFKEFINGLFDIYNKEEITDEDIENIVDCFIKQGDEKNKVFKRSLKSGSCKEYLLELVAYLVSGDKSYLPFSETDLEQPIFSKFLRQLQEGFDDELPKRFFRPEIRVWTYDYIEEGDDSQKIETEFYVHVGCGKNENRNVVTVKELSKLGVYLPQEVNTFDIYLKITQNDGTSIMSEEKRTYFKIGNKCNDFCGAFGSDITTSINLFDVKEISLLIVCGEYQKVIYQYPIPQYLELYSTEDFYLWTTKTNNAARKVLLYNTSEYMPLNVNEREICYKSKNKDNEDTGNEWGWICLQSIVRLQNLNNGEIIDITVGSSDDIMVDFRTKNLKKDVVLTSDGCLPSVIDGEPGEPVHILYYSRDQELMLACDGLKGKELLDNYKLEFKCLHDIRYSEWTNNIRPSQGFIKLRISCRDVRKRKRTWIGKVYFIPKTNIIRRNIDNKYITFEGNNVCPTNDTLLTNFNTRNNKFQDSQDLGLDSPTTSFRIGDEENHIIIDVYRAFRWQQIWHNDTLIKDKIDGDKPPVAIILQKNIKIKSVNENGYNEYSPSYCEYIHYFKDPRSIAFYEKNNVVSRGLINDSSQTYQPYVYLSRYEDRSQGEVKVRMIEKNENSIILYASDKHIDQYIFYYWSGMLEDIPVKLECRKLEDKKYQYSFPSELRGKAVIFQSRRDCKPNMYFRPFYADDTWNWNYYINRYSTVNNEYLIKCFDYAAEHHVYFCIFPALRKLQSRDIFTEFIRTYIQQKNYNFSDNDKKNLTRLAKELAMDCFFVDRKKLFSKLDEDNKKKMRKCMKELLLCSPIERREHAFSKRFIDRFLRDTQSFKQRNGKLHRQFLNAIDCFNSYDGCDNTEKRISFLTQLVHSEDNIFKELKGILNL